VQVIDSASSIDLLIFWLEVIENVEPPAGIEPATC
jgi:hypothetical protein